MNADEHLGPADAGPRSSEGLGLLPEATELLRWEKLARDADEQTPAGDGGQRLSRRKVCPLCDLPPDSLCQFANCKRMWAE